ncbi:MAG: flagellar biosynthesis repressor FlbT [Rhodospirillales bacterium]|jgi:flagellar protein FlbT
MPLKIELKPGEKFIVNGAVMVAGKSGASLALRNQAVLLRGRDVMQESEATTPARRLYFTLMLMYIDPDNRAAHAQSFARFLGEYLEATTLASTRAKLERIGGLAVADEYYAGLKLCRELIALEDSILTLTQSAANRAKPGQKP